MVVGVKSEFRLLNVICLWQDAVFTINVVKMNHLDITVLVKGKLLHHVHD